MYVVPNIYEASTCLHSNLVATRNWSITCNRRFPQNIEGYCLSQWRNQGRGLVDKGAATSPPTKDEGQRTVRIELPMVDCLPWSSKRVIVFKFEGTTLLCYWRVKTYQEAKSLGRDTTYPGRWTVQAGVIASERKTEHKDDKLEECTSPLYLQTSHQRLPPVFAPNSPWRWLKQCEH